ncbi:MAG: hypothetical protein HY741_24990 [Chloroflexi bacterium]|nr:hypothetical protein [Chloroflexota bacterium]
MRLILRFAILLGALLSALGLAGCGQDTPIGVDPRPANPSSADATPGGPTPDVNALLANLVGTPPVGGATLAPSSLDAFQTEVAVTRAPSATPNPKETLANVPATDTPSAQGAPSRLPECPTPPGYTVRMPDTFPSDFPFPNGANLVKFSRLNKNTNYIQLVADVPLPLREAAVYMLTELPKRGYTFVRGDSEWNEMEGIFRGKGFRGAFRISAFSDCYTNTLWTIVVYKES